MKASVLTVGNAQILNLTNKTKYLGRYEVEKVKIYGKLRKLRT